uniref:Uncharacterized protein n=1 Tax=Arundo donax TaxID=35708 RepID=A0A0A8XWW6_ARUDO
MEQKPRASRFTEISSSDSWTGTG